MKRVILFLWIVAILPGCATQVVDGWVGRADDGLIAAEANVSTIFDRLRENEASDRKVGMGKYLDGLKAAHADGKLNDVEFGKYETKLAAFLDASAGRTADRNAEEKRALGNLEEIRKCLGGIQQASRAFGTSEDVGRRLDRIEDLVKTAITAGSKK